MSAKIAEQLWIRAHEHLTAGNTAQAVRDLAKAYSLLKDLKDPRLAQVHKRWTEVHQLYLKQKSAKESPPPTAAELQAQRAQAEAARVRAASEAQAAQFKAAQEQAAQVIAAQAAAAEAKAAEAAAAAAEAEAAKAKVDVYDPVAAAEERYQSQEQERLRRESAPMSLEEQAETAANQGDLKSAIALYESAMRSEPDNELAAERLDELRAAFALEQSRSVSADSMPRPVSGGVYSPYAPLQNAGANDEVAFLQQLLTQVQDRRKPVL